MQGRTFSPDWRANPTFQNVFSQNMFFVWINQPSLQSVHQSLRKHSSSQNDPRSPNQHHNPAKLKTLSIAKKLQIQRENHLDHGWGQFSSKGSLGGLVAILGSDTDVLRQLVRHVLQITAGNTNHHLERDCQESRILDGGWFSISSHLAIGIEGTCSQPRTDWVDLGLCSVHLPVPANKEFSTHFVVCKTQCFIFYIHYTDTTVHSKWTIFRVYRISLWRKVQRYCNCS